MRVIKIYRVVPLFVIGKVFYFFFATAPSAKVLKPAPNAFENSLVRTYLRSRSYKPSPGLDTQSSQVSQQCQKQGSQFFQLAFSPLVSVLPLRTDAPVSGGAARKGEGKVNSLIGMSTIPHTYLTPKPWELQPKSDTFLSGENSQAVKSSIYCQLQYLISIFWPWVSQYFSSTVTTLSLLFPYYYFFLVARSRAAFCYDLIPLFIHIGISCINYGPLIVPEIRNRSSPSGRFSRESQLLSGGVGRVPVRSGSEAG